MTALGFSGLWLAFALTLLEPRRPFGALQCVALRGRGVPSPRPPYSTCGPSMAALPGSTAGVLLIFPALVLLNGLSPYLGPENPDRLANVLESQPGPPRRPIIMIIPYSLDIGGFLADSVAHSRNF